MERRANGEGSIYSTVQKIKKEFDNLHMCETCKNCTDRIACNNRQGYDKCEICKNCKEDCLQYCDRFRCYQRTVAQIYENNERHTVGTGKTKREANNKKAEKIKSGKIVNKNNITLSPAMKNFVQDKLKYGLIGQNTYIRSLEIISAIERTMLELKIEKTVVQKLTERNIKDIIISFVNYSQSQMEKVYDLLNGTIKYLYENDKISNNIMKNIKRNTFISNVDKKNVEAFSIEETRKIIKYVNEHENSLVKEIGCSYDCKTIKNFIKLAFATSMRCGELGSIDIEKDIDLNLKRFIVSTTLTKDEQKNIIIGTYTKTGRKQRQAGSTDKRIVPFGIIFDENEVSEIVIEQVKHAKDNLNNKDNLLFTKKDGSYINHGEITSIFKKICRRIGVKLDLQTGCAIHMTKHTGVSRMIENGMDIYVISKIVGTTVEVLQKTYAHILDNFIERELEKSKNNRENISINNIKTTAKIIPFKRTI